MDSILSNCFSELKRIIENALVDNERERFLKDINGLSKKSKSKNINISQITNDNVSLLI